MKIVGEIGLAIVILTGVATADQAAAASSNEELHVSATQCEEYVGQVIQPQAFADAVLPFAAVPEKSEFETTDQYEARKVAALAGTDGSPLIIAIEQIDRKHLPYDADAQVLSIIRYAFSNIVFDARQTFSAAGVDDKIDVGLTNVALVVSSIHEDAGTYEATNAYGAKAQIIKINGTLQAIFEGKATSLKDSLFPFANEKPYAVGQLQLTPEQAMSLKPTLKLAISVLPKDPFFVSGTRKALEPTVRNPRDITQAFTVLIADFQCGFVLDPENTVLGAYPAR